jgi:hypothetical protein
MRKKTIKAMGQPIEHSRVLAKNSLLLVHFTNSRPTFNSELYRAPAPFRIKKNFDAELQFLLHLKQSFRLSKLMASDREYEVP